MIRGRMLTRLTVAALPGVFAVVVSSVGAYVAITKAQANQETRIRNVENTQKEQPAAIDKAEQRINQRLDQIQTDVREIRKDQTELLREMARQK